MIILHVTCAEDEEARKIGEALLTARLVSCVRRSLVTTSNWWDGEIEHHEEVLLTMESREEKFDAIEKVVKSLHSYETFVLTAVPVLKTTVGVEKWLDEELANN